MAPERTLLRLWLDVFSTALYGALAVLLIAALSGVTVPMCSTVLALLGALGSAFAITTAIRFYRRQRDGF